MIRMLLIDAAADDNDADVAVPDVVRDDADDEPVLAANVSWAF